MFFPYFFSHPLIELAIFATFGLSIWAQFKVKGNYETYAKVTASSGISGSEAARHLLNRNGLTDVPVEVTRGKLTDHYDPIQRVVRLSEGVYYGRSISSISIASHEVGHAIQHAEAYSMLVLRHRIFPVLNLTSSLAPMLFLIGFLFQAANLILVGIIFFSIVVAFQMITLPVEFNASSRAKQLMVAEGFIRNDEERGVNKVLTAAALTYVAAAAMALLQLLRYVFIFTNMRSRD